MLEILLKLVFPKFMLFTYLSYTQLIERWTIESIFYFTYNTFGEIGLS